MHAQLHHAFFTMEAAPVQNRPICREFAPPACNKILRNLRAFSRGVFLSCSSMVLSVIAADEHAACGVLASRARAGGSIEQFHGKRVQADSL